MRPQQYLMKQIGNHLENGIYLLITRKFNHKLKEVSHI